MDSLALQDDVIHRAARLVIEASARNACLRANATRALYALNVGDIESARTYLTDLLDHP